MMQILEFLERPKAVSQTNNIILSYTLCLLPFSKC